MATIHTGIRTVVARSIAVQRLLCSPVRSRGPRATPAVFPGAYWRSPMAGVSSRGYPRGDRPMRKYTEVDRTRRRHAGDAAPAGRCRRRPGRPGTQEPKECGEDGLRENAGRDSGRAVRADQRPDHGQGDDLRRRSSPSSHVPDRNGKTADVVLGFDTLDGYLARTPVFRGHHRPGRQPDRQGRSSRSTARNTSWPPTTGRTRCTAASRASTRSSGRPRTSPGPAGPAVKLTYLSPDGEEGFPGNLSVGVTYTVTADNALQDRLRRHDRQGHAGQPDQPQLFQPGRAGLGYDPRPRADAGGRPVHAGRRRR